MSPECTVPAPSFSLAHATLLHLPPPELVRVAAATGYQHVGFRLISLRRPGEPGHHLSDNPTALNATKRALHETGLGLLDVEVALIKQGHALRSYLPALETAAELGGRFVLTNVYTRDRAFAEDEVAALCDLVQPLSLTVALEPVSFSDLSTVADAVDLARRTSRQNVSVLIDCLHVHSSRDPLSELSRIPPDRVHYVHVCDGPREVPEDADERRRIAREARLLPGEGGIDVTGILRHLPANLVYAVEVHNPARAANLGAEVYARLALEKTAHLIEGMALDPSGGHL